MVDLTNGVELFKSALLGEAKAAYFYQLASELTDNDEARMLFLSMVDTEEDHTRQILEKISQTSFSAVFDAANWVREEASKVTVTLAADEEAKIRTGTLRDMLQMAINMENQAKEGYLSLHNMLVDEGLKAYCRDLARQEELHQQALTRLLDSLSMDPEDRPGL
ncbi:MAG: ferritin family protein [Magnetococcales bacterium]|nr:ferritin family protein [Magnetococcales bacterium]